MSSSMSADSRSSDQHDAERRRPVAEPIDTDATRRVAAASASSSSAIATQTSARVEATLIAAFESAPPLVDEQHHRAGQRAAARSAR